MPPPSLRSGLAAPARCYAPVLRAPSCAPCFSASWPRCRGLLPLPAKGVLFCVLSVLRCRALLLVFVLGQLALSRSALRFSPRPQQRWGCRCWVGGGAPPPSLAAFPAPVGATPLWSRPRILRGLRKSGVPPQGAGRFFRLTRSRIQGQSGLRPLPLPLVAGCPCCVHAPALSCGVSFFLTKVPLSCRPPLGPTSARCPYLLGHPPRFCTKKKRNAECPPTPFN